MSEATAVKPPPREHLQGTKAPLKTEKPKQLPGPKEKALGEKLVREVPEETAAATINPDQVVAEIAGRESQTIEKGPPPKQASGNSDT